MSNNAIQNSAEPFAIFADDETAIGTGKTGLTITATLCKNGAGSFSAVSPTYAELGGGWYRVTPIAAHRDTLGESVWAFAATGAIIAGRREVVALPPYTPNEIVRGIVTGTVPNGSLARFVRDIKMADVLFEGQIVTAGAQTATLDAGATSVCFGQAITIGEEGDVDRQSRFIVGFDPATKVITLDMPWCVIPPDGRDYQIKVLRNALAGDLDKSRAGSYGAGIADTKADTTAILAAQVGDWSITRTFQISGGDKVSGVRMSLVGVAGKTATTGTDGVAVIKADDGTFTLRFVVPAGYEDVADTTVTINGADSTATVTLVATTTPAPPSPDACVLSVYVRNQATEPFPGVTVTGRFPRGWSVADGAMNLNEVVTDTTDANGLAQLVLVRDQDYDLSFSRVNGTIAKIRITTPDAATATLNQSYQG